MFKLIISFSSEPVGITHLENCYFFILSQIWQCLAEKAAFPSDRECCFKWFSKVTFTLRILYFSSKMARFEIALFSSGLCVVKENKLENTKK